MIEHFGVKIKDKGIDLKLSRNNFTIINKKNGFYPSYSDIEPSIYEDAFNKYYTDEWCDNHLANCLINFDKSMIFFKNLEKEIFEKELESFLAKNKEFEDIKDISKLKSKKGYYLMVLDEYKQIYIGTSDSDMFKRVKRHWRDFAFDRTLFPMGNVNSTISINSFRPLDTTRIYASVRRYGFYNESKYIHFFNKDYICNRMTGGRASALMPINLSLSVMMLKDKNLDDKQ